MPARSIQLEFGPFRIPAKAEVATEPRPTFSNMCVGQPGKDAHEAAPLKMPKTCTHCGEVTDMTVLVKGLKEAKTYRVLDTAELEALSDKFSTQHKGEIKILAHPAETFLAATAPGDSLHYITPADAGGANHYQLLTRLIASHPELAFVGLHTPLSVTSLYRLTVREGVLVMEKRVRADAVRPAPSVGGEVNEDLLQVLDTYLATCVTEYTNEAYEDHYLAELRNLAENAQTVTFDDVDVSKVVTSDDAMILVLEKLAKAGAKPKKAPARKRAAKKTAKRVA